MKVIFFGDSVCFGQFVSTHKTWVSRLSETLHNKFGNNIWINNISHSGDTTRIALEKIAYDVQAHGIDIIVIQFGMNDCNYWETDKGLPRVSSSSFKENLHEIINRSRHFGAKQIIQNTNHPTTKIQKFDYADISYQESNEIYNEIIREVSRLENTNLIDIEQMWKDKILYEKRNLDELLLEDQVHLSLLGHELYYECVTPIIEKIIKDLLCTTPCF